MNDEKKFGLGAAIVVGGLAALYLARKLKKIDNMSEAEALRELEKADPLTPEGQQKFARAWKRLDTIRREQRGEMIDEGTRILQEMEVAWLEPGGTERILDGTQRLIGLARDDLQRVEEELARQGVTPDPLCSSCGGGGRYICPGCRGMRREEMRDFHGRYMTIPCTQCGGEGTKICQVCRGTGRSI